MVRHGRTEWNAAGRFQGRAGPPLDEYRRWSSGLDIRRGGGETLAEAGRRVADRIEAARSGMESHPLVVVGHDMALQAALGRLCSRSRASFHGEPPHLGHATWLALPLPGGGPPPIA